jgi:hypothetical protein
MQGCRMQLSAQENVPVYDLRAIDTQSAADHACGMLEKNRMRVLLAALVFVCLLDTDPVQAGFMDFSVESLKTEDSEGC